MAALPVSSNPIDARPWTFYALAALFTAYMAFLYGPMVVIYVLSFQGPEGGVTFPMVGTSLEWFRDIWRKGQMASIPSAFQRSIALAAPVSLLTVTMSVAGALAFRRRFPGSGIVFYIVIASLVMPSLLVGFGIGLAFQFIGFQPTCSRRRLALNSRGRCRSACSPCLPSSTASTARGRKRRPISAPHHSSVCSM